MWVVPKNYPASSLSAQDMLESKEDLTLPGLNIESSLMWRSKPSQLRTWSTRWKRENWLRHLFGRTLKPCQYTCFETMLTSSLAGTHANPSPMPVGEKGLKTPATYGPTLATPLEPFDLDEYFSRMSKVTLASDLVQCSQTWKNEVTTRRGEYSARLKSARLTRESASTLWATPNTMDHMGQRSEEALRRQATTTRKGRTRPANLREQVNPDAVAVYALNWPTPTARDYKGGYAEKSLRRTDGKLRHLDALPNAAIGGLGTDVITGHLNPDWVEWLMGVPTGWTELDCSGTE